MDKIFITAGKTFQPEPYLAAKEMKKQKLITLAYSVLKNPAYQHELETLMNRLGVSEEEVIESYLAYNLDIYAFGNEICNSVANRFILHMHNLLIGSWHQERQKATIKMLRLAQANTIIDVGFGVPSLYIKELVLKQRAPHTTLCDLFDTAFRTASTLLDLWDNNWKNVISFKKTDMQHVEDIGSFDTYLFQDTIEHVPDPTHCLSQYVQLSPSNATFILTLPIGPQIPAHYIAWHTDDEAITWLKHCGLNVEYKEMVWVNLETDIFAEPLGADHHNLIVLCSKQTPS